MNINEVTPAFFDSCCALLGKDAVSDITNQVRCSKKAKVVVIGSVYAGHLFTKTGDGDTAVAFCGTHSNTLSNKGKINIGNHTLVQITHTPTTKENIMNNPDLFTVDANELADRVQWVTEHSFTYAEALLEGQPFKKVELSDESTAFVEICPEDHVECNINVMETLHEADGEGCCDFDECDHAFTILCLKHVSADETAATTPQVMSQDDYFIIAMIGGREIAKDRDAEAKLVDELKEPLSLTVAKRGADKVRVLIDGSEGFGYAAARACHALNIPFTVVLPNDGYGVYYWQYHSVTNSNRKPAFDKMLRAAHKVLSVGGNRLYVDKRHTNFLAREWMVRKAHKVWVFSPNEQGIPVIMNYIKEQGKPFFEVKVS